MAKAKTPRSANRSSGRAAKEKVSSALRSFKADENNLKALASGEGFRFQGDAKKPKKKASAKKPYVEANLDGHYASENEGGREVRVSAFKDQFDAVLAMAQEEGPEFSADAMAVRLYRTLASMLINIIPIAEEQYLLKRTEGSMYALSSALNGLKDVTDLLRTHAAQDQKIEQLSTMILMPMFMHIAQHLLASSLGLKAAIDSSGLKTKEIDKLKKAINDMLKEHAVYLQAQSEAIAQRVREHFAPPPVVKGGKKVSKKAKQSESLADSLGAA